MKKYNQHKSRKLPAAIALVVAALLISGGLWLEHQHDKPRYTTDAHTTSSAKSAQSNFKGDNKKTIPSNVPDPNATATDENGSEAIASTPSSQWSRSKDRTSIIVHSPISNNLFPSGSVLAGTATSNTVSYRLTDDVSGMLTSGTANVINGKFSIKFTFSTSANTGNVEVFNQKDSFSPETNNVLIPVRFR